MREIRKSFKYRIHNLKQFSTIKRNTPNTRRITGVNFSHYNRLQAIGRSRLLESSKNVYLLYTAQNGISIITYLVFECQTCSQEIERGEVIRNVYFSKWTKATAQCNQDKSLEGGGELIFDKNTILNITTLMMKTLFQKYVFVWNKNKNFVEIEYFIIKHEGCLWVKTQLVTTLIFICSMNYWIYSVK